MKEIAAISKTQSRLLPLMTQEIAQPILISRKTISHPRAKVNLKSK